MTTSWSGGRDESSGAVRSPAVDVSDLALAALIVLVASAVQGSVGFGSSLVAAPLLVLIDPVFVPGPLIAVALVLNVLLMWREDEKVHPHHIGLALAGRLPGSVLGALALVTIPASRLGVVFGLLVLLAVGLSMGGLTLTPTSPAIVGAGLLSGFMGTATSIGGPPIALLYQHETGPAFRATVANLLVWGSFISLGAVVIVGKFGADELYATAVLMPAVMVGFALSGRLTGHLDRGRTREVVLLVSGLSALVVIAREIL
jgi:uncharacterized membrane protein YfcA